MLTLVTGKPGAGKTLWAVAELRRQVEAGRTCFSDIADLSLPGVVRLADHFGGDDVVITLSAVPPCVSDFETHRHRGFDVVLVTQGPRLIDRHLHDLIERHVHLYRPFGLRRSVVSEWGGVSLSPDPVQSRSAGRRSTLGQDRDLFRFYRSASVHTDKARWPWRPILILLGAVVVVAWGAWSFVSGFRPEAVEAVSGLPGDPFGVGRQTSWSGSPPSLTCDPVAVFGSVVVRPLGCEARDL